ncbi:MAG: hypothetical protein KAU14_07200, partial [Thermoplasmata archaeon]|nr:hypothetical protein [Thermoplasmata archaeon]
LSLPIGQSYMRFLKVLELKGKLRKEEENIEEITASAISGAEKTLKKLKTESVPVDELEKELRECKTLQQRSEYKNALKTVESVKKKAKTVLNQMETAREHLRSLKDMKKVAEFNETAEKDYLEAKQSFKKGDFASAMYYAKQAKKILIEAVAQKEYREGEITRIRDVIEDESLDPAKVEACIRRALEAKDRDEFDEHIEQAERELDNALKQKENIFELRDEVVKKIEDALVYDIFRTDVEHIDTLIRERDFEEVKKGLEELNLRVLRKIRGVESFPDSRDNL